MRIGMSSVKGVTLNNYLRHRIIIPVYIPNLNGYFEHALETLELCLESLRVTVAGKANVTIISNGSTPEVVDVLRRHYRAGWIDQFVINHFNRGRVDALVAAARGAFEPFITISDCDVLFKTGWLEAIEQIFRDFPECGFASPVPNPQNTWKLTSATILGGIVRRELAFEKVVPDLDLDRFAQSIGRRDLFRPGHRRAQAIVRRGDARACVGCNHFVFTARREVVAHYPQAPCLKALGGGSPRLLDIPPDKLGFWRLATPRAYAYHLGNTPEAWMYEELRQCRSTSTESATIPERALVPRLPWTSRLPWVIRKITARVIQQLLSANIEPANQLAREIQNLNCPPYARQKVDLR